jgi:protein-S-isoprenylcysteine O-methyltransferase Ste14
MDEELLFRILFVSIYAVFAVIRVAFRIPAAKKEGGDKYELPGLAALTLSFGILAYFACIILYLFYLSWILWFQLPLQSWTRWFSVFIAVLCIPALYWIHHSLGKQYSAELKIQTDHEIITDGPYSRVRHPMYTIFILFSISLAVLTANSLIIFFSIVVSISFLPITKREELMLIDEFGNEYKAYMHRTGRFLPRFRKSE